MVGKYLLHREEREIREVFVIYRVELIVLDQPQEVWELKGDDARRLEGNFKAADKVINVRDVSENVAAE